MKSLLLTCALSIIVCATMKAQVTIEYLDINNVKAAILTHGDMFWNPTTAQAAYEFPKGSGKKSNFASSIWISAKDPSAGGIIKVAAQTYRQSGNDYWPGPIDPVGSTDSLTSNDWDKIWKVNRTTIDSFINTSSHTIANTPAVILEWPAKGNVNAKGKGGVSLSILGNMAPFVDVNGDGIYNALDGDYPYIRGEQGLWWVFNDKKGHYESGSSPLNVEIKAMAYACNSIPGLQNVTFYHFKINYKGTGDLTNARIGIWDDIDLGYGFDDYIGVDTTRRMGICYNGDNNDDGVYGINLTQQGLLILKSPLDVGAVKQPLGAYTYYNNTMSTPTGNPYDTTGYSNYMNSKWIDGQPFTNTCDARSSGTATNYVYPDDPSLSVGMSEKACSNTPNDRRFILSTGDFNMVPGLELDFDFAVLNTNLGTSNANFIGIKALADTVLLYTEGCGTSSFPSTISNAQLENAITISPNPVQDNLSINWTSSLNELTKEIRMINAMGQIMMNKKVQQTSSVSFDTQHLAKGIYILQIQLDGKIINKKFVKN